MVLLLFPCLSSVLAIVFTVTLILVVVRLSLFLFLSLFLPLSYSRPLGFHLVSKPVISRITPTLVQKRQDSRRGRNKSPDHLLRSDHLPSSTVSSIASHSFESARFAIILRLIKIHLLLRPIPSSTSSLLDRTAKTCGRSVRLDRFAHNVTVSTQHSFSAFSLYIKNECQSLPQHRSQF